MNSQHIHTRKTKKSKSTWIVVDDDDLPGSSINFVSCNLAESLGIITFNTPSMEIKGSLIKSMGTKTALTDDATELKKNKLFYASYCPHHHRTPISIPRFRKDESRTHPTICKVYCITCHTAPRSIPFYLKDISDDVIRKRQKEPLRCKSKGKAKLS